MSLEVKIRSSFPPYEITTVVGYLPFEVHGEQFAVTSLFNPLRGGLIWRATHIETGAAVPDTDCKSMHDVPAKAKAELERAGPEKLARALANARALIAGASPQSAVRNPQSS